MSQREFAEFLGVGPASIKRWEMGKIQDGRSNELILAKTQKSGMNVVHAGTIHASTAQGYWTTNLHSTRTHTITGQQMAMGTTIQRYIDGVVLQVDSTMKRKSTFSDLDLSVPTAITPYLASLLLKES
jgi:hypothetical protein